ncbi:hypothetical protein SAMN02745146_0074 [Hymenobacter daecheongensis DSM 21074]|uniref:Uncharacterized protein n=1 Tax=Hymenobacter daecheongensis DSM 21074 TaxID=1121955 RepID=A0A1M6LVX1_9BACT|nr:hypothetical protein [Hymenobacter daecheongensis]SHJ75316.1 hypothetical protein SAMN02745146_0074 [Hymenobacter daecheongensis DSM 21074]
MASIFDVTPLTETGMELAHRAVMHDVWLERVRQIEKFGWQNRPPFEWKIILDEEVGEVSHEVCEVYFQGGEFSEKYRKEMVEVAAVALAAIQNYDYRKARLDAEIQAAKEQLRGSSGRVLRS